MIAVLLLVAMLPGPPDRSAFLWGCLRECRGVAKVNVERSRHYG